MTGQQKGSVLRAAITLTVAFVIGWVVCFWPARALNGEAGVFWMSVAAVCCLVPGWIVVFLSGLAIFSNDLSVMVVQTMIRLFSVAGVAVIIRKLKPDLGIQEFFGWLVGFYFLALGVEVWMLRRNKASSQSVPSQGVES